MLEQSTYLSDNRERELAEYAEWIADEYFPGAPVDPALLAVKKAITLSQNNYGRAFDGLLEHRSGRFHIYCNTARSGTLERRRFTVAHELGHFFIDEHREALSSGRVGQHGSLCDFRSKNPAEREADCFASNLLMPPTRVERELKRRSIGLDTVEHLARTFQTSRTSAAVRLVQLDRAICAAVLWHDGVFVWKWLSESARAAGLRSALAPAERMPPESATGRVIAASAAADASIVRSTSTAATWFQGISAGTSADLILREEAVSLGRFGVLTLLVEHDQANGR
jgi:Zn-dependent peptidase ImmA (M78 family)